MDRTDIQLSEYAVGLENTVKFRYIQKVSVIDVDPFLLSSYWRRYVTNIGSGVHFDD